jgi:hypothetical protein
MTQARGARHGSNRARASADDSGDVLGVHWQVSLTRTPSSPNVLIGHIPRLRVLRRLVPSCSGAAVAAAAAAECSPAWHGDSGLRRVWVPRRRFGAGIAALTAPRSAVEVGPLDDGAAPRLSMVRRRFEFVGGGANTWSSEVSVTAFLFK